AEEDGVRVAGFGHNGDVAAHPTDSRQRIEGRLDGVSERTGGARRVDVDGGGVGPVEPERKRAVRPKNDELLQFRQAGAQRGIVPDIQDAGADSRLAAVSVGAGGAEAERAGSDLGEGGLYSG